MPMTPSGMTSYTPQQIEAIRTIGRERGYSDQEIEARLSQAGITATQSAPGMGGYSGLANFGRGPVGSFARGVVQGAGAVNDMTVGAPARIGAQVAGMPQDPTGVQAANAVGLPQPQTGADSVAMMAGEGLGTAAAMPGVGPGLAALGAASGAAGGMAQQAGASPLGQAAASMAVGVGVPVLGAIGSTIVRTALAGAATKRAAARESMALIQAGNPNAAVTLGQVAQGGVGRPMEGALRNVFSAAPRFKRTLQDQAEQMKERALGIANRYTTRGTPTTAGKAVQEGIREGFLPHFRAMNRQLYDRVYAQVPKDTPVAPSKTLAFFAEKTGGMADAPFGKDLLANPAIQKWSDELAAYMDANPNGIPFETMKQLRSGLFRYMTDGDAIEGVRITDVRRLADAIGADMREVIAQQGDDALRAWDRATLHYSKGMDRVEGVLQPLLDKNVPTKAYVALFEGQREGALILRSTMRSINPEQRRMVAATVIRRLGKATSSAQDDAGELFSPETFLTNWDKLSAEGRRALFEGIDPRLTQDLNALARATSLQREAARALPNPSGTAVNTDFQAILRSLGALGTGGVLGTAMGGPGMGTAAGVLGSAVGANLAGRVFTNPRMVRWLVGQTKVPFGAMNQQLAILAKDAQKWSGPDQEVAMDLIDHLRNTDWTTVLLGQALADAMAVRDATAR